MKFRIFKREREAKEEVEEILKQGYKKIELDDKLECIVLPAYIRYLNNKKFFEEKKTHPEEDNPELEYKGTEKNIKEFKFTDNFFFQNADAKEVLIKEKNKRNLIRMSYKDYELKYCNGNFSKIERLYAKF